MANWMQNVVDNVRESQGKASDFLNGIITDKKTEYIDHRTAIVPGVYAGNSVYRKQALEHIWGVYNMLPDVLTQSMGKLFEIATESMLPPKNMKSLLDYTHDGASVYSTNIRSKYINLKDKKVENLSTVSKSSYMPWYFTDDDNLVGVNYAEYWNIGTPSNVFEHRRTAKEIERDARKAEKKAKKDARKQVREERREERQEKRINRIEEKNKERAERVEKRINKRKESKNKPNEPTNNLNFYDGSYKDMYYEDFLYETVETGIINEDGDFEVEEIPVDFVLRSRLLRKTTELFERGNIHYDEQIYGNLLEKTGGYVDSLGGGQDRGRGKSLKDRDGKFFRSWSHAKRYSLLGDSMRNGKTKSEIDTVIINKVKTQPNRNSLTKNTVLQSNGLVKISPTREDKIGGKDTLYGNIKKCMFSIENLALMDTFKGNNKSKRIMWFPPYDLKFSDNSNVQWNETNFIGRGEPIYTYANTKRSGTLSFTMLIDNPSIIHNLKNSNGDEGLLRFFNGDIDKTYFESKTFNHSTYKIEAPKPTESVNKDNEPQTCFSIYFPYGYSGQTNENSPEIFKGAWRYWLLDGIGRAFNVYLSRIFSKGGYETEKEDGISSINCDYTKYSIEEFEFDNGGWAKCTITKDDNKNVKVNFEGFNMWFIYDIDDLKNYAVKKSEIIDNGKKVKIVIEYDGDEKREEHEAVIGVEHIMEYYLFFRTSSCDPLEKKRKNENERFLDIGKQHTARIRVDSNIEICENGDAFNYTKTTRRNVRPCDDIENLKDGTERLSYRDAFDILEGNKKESNTKLKKACIGEYGIDSIRIVGCYTGTKGVVQNTCKKRCEVVQEWLKEKLSNAKKIEIDENGAIYGGPEPPIDQIHTENAVKMRRVDVYINYDTNMIDEKNKTEVKKDELSASKTLTDVYNTEESGFSVYNEAEYFSTLSETNNIAYNEIKDKIKNFNPAFHSITPEGFAMRLNFLHGCTRQGDTSEGSNSDKVATNLAFGRPPVCVLRIGDFINTKMIIRTLSINYETGSGIQWDLNPEGVGIQPMFAKVQMGIDLIGGQSLEEPVSQLNNALNGLHYANSGIINGKKKE